jgi:F-type H+/Na+-transporting ATPase subunit beta
MADPDRHQGRVAAVRGNVVDVRFPPPLPGRYRALRTGADERIVLEVESHVDPTRCAASR